MPGIPKPIIIKKNDGIEVTILNNNLKGGPIGGPIITLSLRQQQIINPITSPATHPPPNSSPTPPLLPGTFPLPVVFRTA